MKKIGLLISTLVIGGSFYYRDVGAMMMLVIKRVKLPSIFLLGRYIGEKDSIDKLIKNFNESQDEIQSKKRSRSLLDNYMEKLNTIS